MSDPASAPEPPASSRQDSSRRRFLQGGAALGAALVAGAGLPRAARAQPAPDDPAKVLGAPVRPYGERSRFEQAVREKFPLSKTDEVGSTATPLDETVGIITPSALHYEVHRGGVPAQATAFGATFLGKQEAAQLSTVVAKLREGKAGPATPVEPSGP